MLEIRETETEFRAMRHWLLSHAIISDSSLEINHRLQFCEVKNAHVTKYFVLDITVENIGINI